MSDSPTVRVTISLPLETLQRLDDNAKRNKRTRSNAIARMVDLLADSPKANP